MIYSTRKALGFCWMLLLSTSLFVAGQLLAEELNAVYRCPGPPVVYTDGITLKEARARKCKPLESRWREVGQTDTARVYVDTPSLRRTLPNVKVWLMWTYTKSQQTSDASKKHFLSEKNLSIYNCTERSYATIQVIRYSDSDASGSVVKSYSTPEHMARYSEVAPDTIGEIILEYVCTAPESNNN
jgi:hypothetical protein